MLPAYKSPNMDSSLSNAIISAYGLDIYHNIPVICHTFAAALDSICERRHYDEWYQLIESPIVATSCNGHTRNDWVISLADQINIIMEYAKQTRHVYGALGLYQHIREVSVTESKSHDHPTTTPPKSSGDIGSTRGQTSRSTSSPGRRSVQSRTTVSPTS